MFASKLKAACLLICTVSTVLAATSPKVTVGSATFLGVQTSLRAAAPTANAYLGLPFAKPPKRFLPPEPADPINGAYEATRWPAACIQQSAAPLAPANMSSPLYITGAYNTTQSEDCLYLNVFVPTNITKTSKLPVMFWIYGGNLATGSNSMVAYNGASLAASQNVIVVTINYRVNVFGFVASNELPIDARNPGFLDQRLALKWVYSNIGGFGGDPNAITIFGESAGGYSVKQLWVNPPKPLHYRAAIMESEAAILPINDYPTLLSRVNCSTAASPLKCLQNVPASAIVNASVAGPARGAAGLFPGFTLSFQPTVDNVTNTNRPEVAIASGKAARVPVLLGSNGNETAAIIFGLSNYTDGLKVFTATTNSSAAAVVYPGFYASALANGANSPEQVTAHINNQFAFTCPHNIIANTASISGYPIWRYLYNATFSDLDTYPNEIKYGAYHGSDVLSVFGTYPVAPGVDVAAQEALAEYVQGLWAGFAKRPQDSLPWQKVNSAVESLFRIAQDNQPNGTVVSTGLINYDCGLYDEFILALAKV